MNRVLTTLWLVSAGAAVLSGPALCADRGKTDKPGGPQPAFALEQTAHFAVLHSLDGNATANLGDLLEAVFARHLRAWRDAGFVTQAPATPMQWRCFDRPAAFQCYVEREEADMPVDEPSFYSSRSDRVVILRSVTEPRADGSLPADDPMDLRRVSHEAAHQMAFDTGLQTRGVMYPFWVSEGLAVSMETADLAKGEFGGDNPYRRARLVAAYRQNRLCPIGDFLVMTRATGDGDRRADLYAQAWGAVRFLFNRDRRTFKRYLYLLAARPHGQRPVGALQEEISGAFGPVDAMQNDWQRFLREISESGSDAG